MNSKTAVLGSGSWGTALACHLSNKGIPVTLWARNPKTVKDLLSAGENKKYLPGTPLPESLNVTDNLANGLEGAKYIVLAVPSQGMRELARLIRPLLTQHSVLISTAKGFEETTLLRMTEVLAAELPQHQDNIGVLSGPSHAEEVAKRLPTAVVVASQNRVTAEAIQDLFMDPVFRVYTNPDVIGVELGGAVKNVIALATGMADGLGFGDNTRAALMTRGAAEISRLGSKMGAQNLTFAGLAGIGDLIVTCSSMHSRNRRAGIALGQGMPLEGVLSSMGMVVEGITATRTVCQIADNLNVPMPIATEMYQILFKAKDPLSSVDNLMNRTKTEELDEIGFGFD